MTEAMACDEDGVALLSVLSRSMEERRPPESDKTAPHARTCAQSSRTGELCWVVPGSSFASSCVGEHKTKSEAIDVVICAGSAIGVAKYSEDDWGSQEAPGE